jgi:hypothetical protein
VTAAARAKPGAYLPVFSQTGCTGLPKEAGAQPLLASPRHHNLEYGSGIRNFKTSMKYRKGVKINKLEVKILT